MVLLLKQWKSRSSPGFAGGVSKNPFTISKSRCRLVRAAAFLLVPRGGAARRRLACRGGKQKRFRAAARQSQHVGAGWSSPVARQAHNLKVAGSNPAPATNKAPGPMDGGFVGFGRLWSLDLVQPERPKAAETTQRSCGKSCPRNQEARRKAGFFAFRARP